MLLKSAAIFKSTKSFVLFNEILILSSIMEFLELYFCIFLVLFTNNKNTLNFQISLNYYKSLNNTKLILFEFEIFLH